MKASSLKGKSLKTLFIAAVISLLGLTEAKAQWIVSASSLTNFTFNGFGLPPTGSGDPTLTLTRGVTYKFTLVGLAAGFHSFYIKTVSSIGSGNQYTNGVTGNGASSGDLIFSVPQDAPDTLFYSCGTHAAMTGTLNIVDPFVVTAGFGASGFVYMVNGQENPSLTLARGVTYRFNINASGHPFLIKTNQGPGFVDVYNDGVVGNETQSGILTFTVPLNAPDTLFYNCEIHDSMTGVINIADFTVDSLSPSDYTINGQLDPNLTLVRGKTYKFGLNAAGHPFWIKTAAGTNTINAYTNGVTGNGIQTGTLTFAVPTNAPNTLFYN